MRSAYGRSGVASGGVFAAGLLLAAVPAFAQQAHGGGHAVAETAVLVARETAPGVVTLRLGPLDLPARSNHDEVAQAPDRFWEIPFDGWILSYAPSLEDAAGEPVPDRLLHHVAVYHTGRSDFLCPEKEEHIFGAGGEMNEWVELPGFGYRVSVGDRIRVNTMFHNPTGEDRPETYLEVRVAYQPEWSGEARRNVYPTWFDVQECGESDYDLEPGVNLATGALEVPVSGRLLGVGGHLHTYGKELVLADLGRAAAVEGGRDGGDGYGPAGRERSGTRRASEGREIVRLVPRTDEAGRVLSIPIVAFLSSGGYALEAGDVVQVTARYENPTGRRLVDGAMGIVVGYFLPDDEAEMERYRRDGP